MQPPVPVEAAEDAAPELVELDEVPLDPLDDADDDEVVDDAVPDEDDPLLDDDELDVAPVDEALEEVAWPAPPAPPAPVPSNGPVPFAQPHASIPVAVPIKQKTASGRRTACHFDPRRVPVR